MLKNFSSTRPPPPLALSFSDASSTGCGTILSLDDMICHKNWSSDERSKSSTWREMSVHLGLDSFKKFISCTVFPRFSAPARFIAPIRLQILISAPVRVSAPPSEKRSVQISLDFDQKDGEPELFLNQLTSKSY